MAKDIRDRGSYFKDYYKLHREQEKKDRKDYYYKHTKEEIMKSSIRKYKNQYGLTLEQIDMMLIQQNHKCKLCGISLAETKRCIDHDHNTGKVRGILCNKCNSGLGHFNDNEDMLMRAAKYIKLEGNI
jgi:hypothetical protein